MIFAASKGCEPKGHDTIAKGKLGGHAYPASYLSHTPLLPRDDSNAIGICIQFGLGTKVSKHVNVNFDDLVQHFQVWHQPLGASMVLVCPYYDRSKCDDCVFWGYHALWVHLEKQHNRGRPKNQMEASVAADLDSVFRVFNQNETKMYYSPEKHAKIDEVKHLICG